jgi:hypothetical protein
MGPAFSGAVIRSAVTARLMEEHQTAVNNKHTRALLFDIYAPL